MEQYELPDGWVWVRLGEICDIVGGGTPRRDEPDYFEGGNIPWATPTDIDPEQIRLIDTTATRITERGLDESSVRLVPPGTVLFSSRASIGKIAIASVPMATNQGFANLTPHDGIDSWYIAYGLKHFTEQIKELGSGTTYLEIAKSSLREFHFPLAPAGEQLRIAEKIEALFEQSRTAREALDAIPALLRQFRQAVLAAAFRGELSTRDPNDEPASVLLERILAERRRRWEADLRARGKDPRRYTYPEPVPPDTSDLPELPEGWCWTSVNEVARSIQYGYTANSSPDFVGPHYLRITDIQHDSVDWSSVPRCEIEEEELPKYLLKPGDIVFARSGATAGKSYLITDCPAAVFASYLIRVQLFSQVLPEYLYAFFRSRDYWDQIITRGNAQPNANAQVLGAVKFPLAPLSQQRRIVSRVHALFSETDVVEAVAELARRHLDRLDQSILARAFRGELVPQDPDDEPASVLLERIRAERSQRAGERASRRRK